MNVFNEKLLNPAKYPGYNFYCVKVIKGKPIKTNLIGKANEGGGGRGWE